MAIKYQITVKQNGDTKYLSGEVQSHAQLQRVLNQAYDGLTKGTRADVTVSYVEETEECKEAERLRTKKIVKEEFEKMKIILTEYADNLLNLFNNHSDDDWQWFENFLTYSNAVLSEAMLEAYKITGNYHYFKAGKRSLDFLLKNYFQGNICVPVGQAGWYKKGKQKHLYDQQPEEVAILVLALKTMYDLGGEGEYQEKMYQAFNWFLGNNVLNRVMYSHLSGGCFDGLQEKEVNLNQGAESTISYLLARLALENKGQ